MICLPGMLSQGGKKGYRWKRYSFDYVRKEISTGQFTGTSTSTNHKRYSTSYEVSGTEFRLVGSVTGRVYTIKAGSYLVDLTDWSDVTKSDTLYTVTSAGYNSSNVYVVQYKAERFMPEMGTFIDYVSSDNLLAYPLNGAQDGYWYEIVVDGVDKIPYILSTGTQYLDTEYAPGSNTRMILDFAVSSEHTSGEGHIASVRDTGNSLFYTNYINPSQTNWYNGRRGSSAITNFTAVTNGYRRMLWDSNCNVLSVDGSEVCTFTEGDFRLSGGLTIFGRRNINGTTVTVDGFVKMSLWSGILLENGVPVRGYIPCKDPNGVVCTYDVVNNEYIYNAGSGDFIAGE